MTTPVTQQLTPYRVPLGEVPEQGSVAADFSLNFNNDNVFIKETFQEQSKLEIDFVQSIYIDNSASATALTVSIQGTLYSITVKAHTQGWYPIIIPAGKATLIFSKAMTEASIVNITLLNSMLPYVNWATQ